MGGGGGLVSLFSGAGSRGLGRLGGAAAGGLFPEYRLSASPLYPGYGEAGVSFELL